MTRPHHEVCLMVDRMVRELDETETRLLPSVNFEPPLQYASLAERWTLFMTHARLVDSAVCSPLSEEAAAILMTAGGLVTEEVDVMVAGFVRAGQAVIRHLSQSNR